MRKELNSKRDFHSAYQVLSFIDDNANEELLSVNSSNTTQMREVTDIS